jgi:glutathione S-transferase
MSSQDSRLYESNGSPNSRRVRIFLAEKGIGVSRVPVDLGAKEQFSEAYARINPRRVVPTLVLADGTAIGEVPAIFRYLEETHPNTPLFGTSPKDRALVTSWLPSTIIENEIGILPSEVSEISRRQVDYKLLVSRHPVSGPRIKRPALLPSSHCPNSS